MHYISVTAPVCHHVTTCTHRVAFVYCAFFLRRSLTAPKGESSTKSGGGPLEHARNATEIMITCKTSDASLVSKMANQGREALTLYDARITTCSFRVNWIYPSKGGTKSRLV